MIVTNTEELIRDLVDIKSIKYDKAYDRIARIHKYWSRKPWYIIKEYISKYSKIGDTVLDPFCGSGAVGLEAILSERNFIGYDLNPSAIFISQNLLDLYFDTQKFNEEVDLLEKELKPEIMQLYFLDGKDKLYIRYLIVGECNKEYNCVTMDYNFKRRSCITVGDEVLKRHFTIPPNLKFPDKPFPKKFYKDRFSYKGVSNVSDMFSSRNLLALAIIYNFIENSKFYYKNLFLLAFTNTLLHVSKLKAENVRPLSVNNYWIPKDFIEENVIWRFLDRVRNIKVAKNLIKEREKTQEGISSVDFKLYQKSSLSLDEIPDRKIDYIITDPPYGDAIQYSELSFIWNCWLEKDFETQDEVIINPVQQKDIDDFHNRIFEFIKNAKRVLKNNSYFTLCFQNRILKIWLRIVQLVNEEGFELSSIEVYDTFGSPYNKFWARFSPKSDLYVTFKKTEVKSHKTKEIVYPHEVISEIMKYIEENNDYVFDLNKGYDLFVAAVIHHVFNNNEISAAEELDLKKIVSIFEEYQRNGTIPERCTKNIQLQFPF